MFKFLEQLQLLDHLSPTIGIPTLSLLATLVGVPLIAAAIAALAIRREPTVTRRA